MEESVTWSSKRATVGIASRTGPRSASTGVGPTECRVELAGANAQRSRSQLRLARDALAECGRSAQRRLRARLAPERETLAEPDPQPTGTRPAIQ